MTRAITLAALLASPAAALEPLTVWRASVLSCSWSANRQTCAASGAITRTLGDCLWWLDQRTRATDTTRAAMCQPMPNEPGLKIERMF